MTDQRRQMPRARGAASQREEVRRIAVSTSRTQPPPKSSAAPTDMQEPEPTTDSFQIFYNQASRYPLLTGARGARAREGGSSAETSPPRTG